MKTKSGKKTKPQLYSHIASAIIPAASIAAVPSVAPYFPRQKSRANEEWGPLASTLLRASSTNQLLLSSSSTIANSQRDDSYLRPAQRKTIGQIDASSDEEESDEEGQRRKHRESKRNSGVKNTTSQSASLSGAEKRLFGHVVEDEESSTTAAGSTTHLDPKQALTAELSRSERSLKQTSTSLPRQQTSASVLNPVQSQAGPTSGRIGTEGPAGNEIKSVTTTRSSLNDTTTAPVSARSVSFKEPIVYENDDLPSSKSQESVTVLSAPRKSVLDQIVMPLPEDYEQNLNDLERRNQLLNDEVQQVRLNNRNLQKQHEELLDRLQTSQKLSQRELSDLLKQSGRDQTKGLEDLNSTLQNRCDQLQNELSAMKDRYTQNQNQSNLRELKNENHFLKDYIHRLNAASSEYQTTHPPKTLQKEINKEQRKMQSLPMKGPSPIWLLNQKFLAPLFVCYDEKLFDKEEFIKKLQTQLNELHEQVKLITNENISLHERLARSSTSGHNDTHLSDIEHIKRQAYLVLEENKVLQAQVSLQNNRLTDVQKTQIQEVSNLTRRLMIVENEKTDGDRIVETIRIRNEDLKRKYDQLMLDNNHRIHVQEHIQEIGEMKRLTDDLSEKHAHEMQLLLRRVQDAEATKRISQLKLTENRSDVERLKGEIKVLKKLNKKLQLRVQTYEKKLELQQVKEQRIATMFDKSNEDLGIMTMERNAYLTSAKTNEEEKNKMQTIFNDQIDKVTELEERLENYKSKNKGRITEVQEQTKKQHEDLKLRCLEQEQHIQKLYSTLKEKQVLVDDLYAEKRNLEVELETIWQANNADSMHRREQLLSTRITS